MKNAYGKLGEEYAAEILIKKGYKIIARNYHSRFGEIDIIAEKNEERIGIQAKCYSNSVSNSAIQEVVAGISHYRCSKGIVVTNNFFTKSAIELASSNNIVLWDRDILKEKIMELF